MIKYNKDEIYQVIDEWIKYIHDSKLYKEPEQEENSTKNLNIIAYNYLERMENIVKIKVGERFYYIKIYSKIFLKTIDNPSLKKYLVDGRATKNGFRLKSTHSKITRQISIIPGDHGEDDENSSHINDIWSPKKDRADEEITAMDKYQEIAYNRSVEWPISIITGHAGTGKSYVVKYISNKLIEEGWDVSRLAPTGRASQIIQGKTIHSWLEPVVIDRGGDRIEIAGFKKDIMSNKECLIIDESSMIDEELWSEIIRIWRNSKSNKYKKIILVGDPGQLKPVGEGQPFIDLIESKRFPVTDLKTYHRNKDNSDLIDFSIKLRSSGHFDRKTKYKKIKFLSEDEMFRLIEERPDIQVITPWRKSEHGSLELNKKIKDIFKIKDNPVFYTMVWNDYRNKYIEDAPVHINDKIVITRNLWKWNITNGTIGIFKGIVKKKIYDFVSEGYSNNRNCYKFINPTTNRPFYLPSNKKTAGAVELAYAITIHKAQGSEFPDAILYIPQKWIEKKSAYTGITRTRGNLYIHKK